jgi:hypothetical protein
VSKETTFLSHSLSNVASKYATLVQLQSSPLANNSLFASSVAECVDAMNAYSLEISKLSLVSSGIDAEISMYETMAQSYTAEGQSVSDEIALLRKELAKEVGVRREKEEYDALAHTINLEGTAGTISLQAQIEAVNAEVLSIESRREEISKEVARKERAFQLLLASVMDLKRMLEEEEGEAGGAAA